MNRRPVPLFSLRRNPCDILGICQQRRPPCKGCTLAEQWDSPRRRSSGTKRLVVWMTKLLGVSVFVVGCVVWLGLLIVEGPR